MKPDKRGERRHKRDVKLERRYRILTTGSAIPTEPERLSPRCMHWHINCGCFGRAIERRLERKRDRRRWRAEVGL